MAINFVGGGELAECGKGGVRKFFSSSRLSVFRVRREIRLLGAVPLVLARERKIGKVLHGLWVSSVRC